MNSPSSQPSDLPNQRPAQTGLPSTPAGLVGLGRREFFQGVFAIIAVASVAAIKSLPEGKVADACNSIYSKLFQEYLGQNVEKPKDMDVPIEGTPYVINIIHTDRGKNGLPPSFMVSLVDTGDTNNDTKSSSVVFLEYDDPKAKITTGSPMSPQRLDALKKFVASVSDAETMTLEQARDLMTTENPEAQKVVAAFLSGQGIKLIEAERLLLASSGGQQ